MERARGENQTVRRFAVSLILVLLASACATAPKRELAPAIARFFLESSDGSGGVATLPKSGVRIAVGLKPVISEFDIINVDVAQVDLGKCLRFQMTRSAARDLYRLTASNQDRRLVLLLNGAPMGARRIERPFDDGTILIFVEISDDALPALAESLRNTAAELKRSARKS